VRLSDIGDPRRGDAPSPLAEPADAIAFDAPSVVVLGVRRGDLAPTRFATALVEALATASRPVVVHALRRSEGAFEPDADTRARPFLDAGARAYRGGRVGPDAAAIDAQLRAWSKQDHGAFRVLVGTDFAARAHGSAVVAITAGLPLIAWSPAARSVVSRVSLQLAEPREAVARGLVRRLLPGTCP
jgi:hypothetical protein